MPGCWISVVDPTAQERKMLIDDYGLDSDFLKSSLDEEESSRVEQEENQTLIIVDTAVSEVQKDDTLIFYTMPLGIILTDHYVFTISLRENKVINDVVSGRVRNIQTQFRTQFVLRLMMNITASFLVYLKQILRGRIIKLYEDDQDLLEDVLIELEQAQEMASIYSGILSGVVDAFGSVISNNLNIVMWRLTMVTIILAIPTMVYSFYGMNTLDLPFAEHTWFPTLLSLLLTAIVAFVLFKYKKK